MSPRTPSAGPSRGLPSPRTIAVFAVLLVLLFAFQWLVGPWWALGSILVLLAVVAIVVLLATRTAFGRKAAAATWRPLSRTRIGKRIAHRQLMWAAKARGVRTTDLTGRPLSDFEIQLELLDTPEARAIKKQLRNANPQQRAQALRMLQAQAEEAARTGVAPKPIKPPRQRYGRPR